MTLFRPKIEKNENSKPVLRENKSGSNLTNLQFGLTKLKTEFGWSLLIKHMQNTQTRHTETVWVYSHECVMSQGQDTLRQCESVVMNVWCVSKSDQKTQDLSNTVYLFQCVTQQTEYFPERHTHPHKCSSIYHTVLHDSSRNNKHTLPLPLLAVTSLRVRLVPLGTKSGVAGEQNKASNKCSSDQIIHKIDKPQKTSLCGSHDQQLSNSTSKHTGYSQQYFYNRH